MGDSFDGAVVLFNDVVHVFFLSHQDVNAGVGLHTFSGRCIGAAIIDYRLSIVDCDLLGNALEVDGTLHKAPSSSLISLSL